ncbi:hypothetical protein CsSME_00052019 [Camellia sinensis var. sinensis]
MASNGQKEKIGDDTPAGSRRPIDLDVERDECNAETRDQNHGVKDVGQTGNAPKKPDRSGYYTRTTSRYGRIGTCGGTKR